MNRRALPPIPGIGLSLLTATTARAWIKPFGGTIIGFHPDGNLIATDAATVKKLEPRFGGTVWTSLPSDIAFAGAVDAAGNVVMRELIGTNPDYDVRIPELDGATGTVSWTTDRHELYGTRNRQPPRRSRKLTR